MNGECIFNNEPQWQSKRLSTGCARCTNTALVQPSITCVGNAVDAHPDDAWLRSAAWSHSLLESTGFTHDILHPECDRCLRVMHAMRSMTI